MSASMKGLTFNEFNKTLRATKSELTQRLGERPHRRDFMRDQEPLFDVLDVFAVIVFVAAWIASSLHIIKEIGQAAFSSYGTPAAGMPQGILGSAGDYVTLHQFAFVLLAEFSMLLFGVMWASRRTSLRQGENMFSYALRSALSIPLWLFVGSALFVVNMNIASGLETLPSVLAPAVTIGLAIYMEEKLGALLRRRQEITRRYTSAVTNWDVAQDDIQAHEEFIPVLSQALDDVLRRKNSKIEPGDDEVKLAVAAELARLQRYNRDDMMRLTEVVLREQMTELVGEEAPVQQVIETTKVEGDTEPVKAVGRMMPWTSQSTRKPDWRAAARNLVAVVGGPGVVGDRINVSWPGWDDLENVVDLLDTSNASGESVSEEAMRKTASNWQSRIQAARTELATSA